MKLYIIAILCIASIYSCFGQAAGNSIFQTQNQGYSAVTINQGYKKQADFNQSKNINIQVKGIYNVVPDAFVAVFSVSQVGTTAEEVDALLNERINQVKAALQSKANVEIYVDMISFVPVYEQADEKRIFNKKTFNEIPIGFELTKNLHVKFKDTDVLDAVITACSKSEIYDIIKVECFSDSLEIKKKELMTKVKAVVNERVKYTQEIVGGDFLNIDKTFQDKFQIYYPVEMYKSNKSIYRNTSLKFKSSASSNQYALGTTLYYQPILSKEYDVVINPVIMKPVIQIEYELYVVVKREPTVNATKTEYYIVKPTGELQKISIGQ